MNNDPADNKCPVTDRDDVIDDCYIEISFGYGSDKDMWRYNFDAVHDIVGKKVLELIQSLMNGDKSVEDFGIDTLAVPRGKMLKDHAAKDCTFGMPPNHSSDDNDNK